MISTHAGGNVYSNSVYDLFTGRVTRQYVVDKPLRNGAILRKWVTVIDVGRPDDVAPADADEAMQDEPLPSSRQPAERKTKTQEATYSAQLYADRQRASRINAITELLQAGPCSTATAAAHVGVTPRTIKYLLPFAPHIREFGRRADGVWIGLDGQTLPARDRPALTGNGLACYIYIKTHGPSTLTELKLALNVGSELLRRAMRHRDDVFAIVERMQSGKYRSVTTRWGLVGDI